MADLESFQQTYEQRFGCCICLGPKLKMVSGECQHRICDDCLYLGEDRRPCMTNCPLCGLNNAFPQKRPIIPLQVIEIQRCIGVQECPNKCSTQMWYWEVEDHLQCCPKTVAPEVHVTKPVVRVTKKTWRSKRVTVPLAPVSVTSRVTRVTRQTDRLKRRQRMRECRRQNNS